MIRKDQSKNLFAANPSGASDETPRLPKRPYVAAVNRLEQAALGNFEVDYSDTGDVRTLVADGDGLFALPFTGDALDYARKFIAQTDTKRALGLRYATLVDGTVTKFQFGTRVEFRQTAKVSGFDGELTVRGGFVHVFIDKKGHIIQVESSVRRGRKPSRLGKLISKDVAIAKAKEKHGTPTCNVKSCELVLSSHEGDMDPVYEITLEACDPELKIWQYLVKAKTAEVVYGRNKLYFSQKSPAQSAVDEPACKYFPVTPDPKVALTKQIIDYAIAGLPDTTKLQNQRFKMLVKKGGQWVVAKAQADGTFNYKESEPEFEAVIIFIALNEMTEYQEKCGLPKLTTPIPVYVHDTSVRDNAYFDPENMEIHIGVGSGVPAGLRKFIGFDKMVERHEFNGHGAVTVITPGHDLPGAEGAGEHEAAGDIFALIGEYLDRVKFAKLLGITMDIAYVQKDPRIIGPYSLDGGIRKQRSNKTTKDKTGEPHDDGEIIGAALADTLEAVIVKANDVASGCEKFSRLYLASLALRPAHKVLWTDALRTFITADQTLFAGEHRSLIEKAFADHGIKLASGQNRKKPQPQRRKPSGGKNRRRKSA